MLNGSSEGVRLPAKSTTLEHFMIETEFLKEQLASTFESSDSTYILFDGTSLKYRNNQKIEHSEVGGFDKLSKVVVRCNAEPTTHNEGKITGKEISKGLLQNLKDFKCDKNLAYAISDLAADAIKAVEHLGDDLTQHPTGLIHHAGDPAHNADNVDKYVNGCMAGHLAPHFKTNKLDPKEKDTKRAGSWNVGAGRTIAIILGKSGMFAQGSSNLKRLKACFPEEVKNNLKFDVNADGR
jgi:hypothetical protein